jgi:hypothetical protein
MRQQALQPFSLPERWNTYLGQIEQASMDYWATHYTYGSYKRVQSMATWEKLRIWLRKITDILLVPPLTPFENFLLHAAAYLYEVGWQTQYGSELLPAERYRESGHLILLSREASQQNYRFGLFDVTDQLYADDIAYALAQICSAMGLTDLSSLEVGWQVACYEEQIRPRYLVALLQLADIMLIDRPNKNNLYDPPDLDLADARLALQKNIKLEQFQPGSLKISYSIHVEDQPFREKMLALYEEPLRRWWFTNRDWLAVLGFAFVISQPEEVKSITSPFTETCRQLRPFLKNFQPEFSADYNVPPLPEKKKRFGAYICCSRQDRTSLQKLRKHLDFFIRRDHLHIWDDTLIEPGTNWRSKLEETLQTTKIAVLLISPDFLVSDFSKNELPRLLEAAEKEGAIIFPVLLTASAFDYSPLEKYTPINKLFLDKFVKSMQEEEEETLWLKVAEYVRKVLLAPE